ncbi:mitochondrial fission ELM1 family protein [Thermomonas carbonis]|uniref:Mitochondrial fission ELM1 family protein n=1 Tax=Thermomonas carbonis TaxID=1463158 RepID=A0A7G9SRT2_9GAMM|nr:mitochondrial fission ELM1 family protein [Thermomonas carbonis]QNN70557.1 mitochondrial fission ELM1 family protein [Thermomonas carbonis]
MNRVLALHDGRAGNARQATALARALAPDDAREFVLQPNLAARRFAPRTWPLLSDPFGHSFRAGCEHPPHIAIGCGRQAALATRLLRARGSQSVQILDPRIDTRHWDLVVAPEHDSLRGDNVITTLGSLHPVDDRWLAQARKEAPQLAALPSPHTLLLVGGPTRHAALDDAAFAALLAQLSAHALRENGSFSMVASRRTPERWRAMLTTVPADIPGIRWRDERDGPNPYAGLLAHADRIVCTPDSVNMLSEAAATPAPVFVWSAGVARGRLRIFLDALRASRRVRGLDDALLPFAIEPLRETARVAAEVRRRLGLPLA